MSEVVEAAGWPTASLGEVVELKRGYDLPKQDRISGSVPLVSSSGVTDYHAEAKVKGPGVVTGRYGTLGEVFYVEEDFWPLNTTLYVRDFKGNDPRFISYFLRTLDFFAYSDKAAVPGLNRNHLHQEIVSVPPLDEQRAISHVLGALDDKIELNRRMNETLEAMARALFQSWFVDFEPVRAKMEGRWRPGESLPGLPAHLHPLFPDRLVPSELGDIPEGWEASTIGQHLTTLLGGTPARSEPRYWGGAIPWINSGAVNASRILAPSEFITEEGLAESAAKMLPVRTTVIAITGATLGQVSLTEIETAANQSVVGVLSSRAIPGEYVYGWVEERIAELVALQTGGAQQHVNKGNVNELLLMVPAPGALRAYIHLVRPIFDEIALNHRKSFTLAAQRDGLLPRLVAGELHVSSVTNLPEARD